MAANTVNIKIKVDDFRDIKNTGDEGRFCLIEKILDSDITPAPGSGIVHRYDGDDRTVRLKKNGTGGKDVDLVFTIIGPQGGTGYTVAGVIFNNRGFDAKHAKGQNFTVSKIEGNKVTINNAYSRGKTYWELYIAIQNPETGAIGLIDPGVENSDSE